MSDGRFPALPIQESGIPKPVREFCPEGGDPRPPLEKAEALAKAKPADREVAGAREA